MRDKVYECTTPFITFHETNIFAKTLNCICWRHQSERIASLFIFYYKIDK